ncbi:protein of unknown function DUF262 [Candidatus Magnetoovum chiemensis]|nr:protein of unknown function DUF262 [Candidatus Magnetoovum chiemensis]
MEQHTALVVNNELSDGFDDQTGEEDLPSPEIPKEERKLRTQSYDMTITDLVKKIEKKKLILDPDYQRNYLWDDKKASLLIESVLLNVPIPVIYVAQDKDNKWTVIDGLQRLHSLRRFYKNKLKLTKLDVLTELNNLTYENLPPRAKTLLEFAMLRVITILEETHPEIKYDIFMRLNRGSVELNEQELRNCLYRGKFIQNIKELVKNNTTFLKLLKLKEPHKRFIDAELILRFFAIHDAYDFKTKKLDYPGTMKTFLNNYMEKNKNLPDERFSELKTLFNETVDKVNTSLGEFAFRRPKTDGSYDSKINRALSDVVMLCFSMLDYDTCRGNSEIHKNTIKTLCADKDFIDAISYSTSLAVRIETRLKMGLEAFHIL